ncbi:DUF3995 domain-containing protein [Corynebacterium sp.]|uniref:DUF3995 domain-containing protein n=1 Tax=Corynebacterium sp. TaxID=1720 RepID=UPI0026E00E1C|nr:DUF3995 domain-containing protein [Corynebacterium sp.]MDO5511628.1 DUF3995 domain-containing protein [Corynebacterium sp.]
MIRAAALWVAALAGVIHGAFSLYWAAGGTWLLETVGEAVTDQFAGLSWVLAVVGVLKLALACGPLLIDAPWARILYWLGAAALIVWGGVNTLTTNLMLAGVLPLPAAVDRPALIGHAWIWDPLFLVWGVALAVGLWQRRRVRRGR